MFKRFLRICSMILTIVMVINLLPAQALGEMIFTEKQSISAADETLSANATVTSPAEEEPAYIVGEIEERRTEHSKEFRLSNGMQLAVVYDNPVHYDNDGTWAEIDNTLKTTTEGTYTNTAGVWEVALPQQMSANSPVTITKDGYTLSFVLAGELNKPSGAVVMSAQATESAQSFALASTQTATAQMQDVGIAEAKAAAEHPETISDKLTSKLLYADVFTNTNVTYDLDSNKVKESIIMEQYDADLRGYKYTLNVGELVPVLYDDGRIDFFNADKSEIIMTMPAPFLVDAGYAYNEDIQVQLAGKGSAYTLTYILPQSWLADEERQWPVILDPVVSAGNANSNIQDQEIAEKTTVSHTRGVMEAGYGENGGIERFFIKYAELPQFTAADVIVHAQVSLMKPNNYPTSAVIEVHEVLTQWESSTLHWSNKPEYNPIIEDYKVVEDAGTYTWDITNIVRGWYEGTNTGMMFKASDEVEQAQEVKWMQFYSSDCGFSSGRPALEITYENHNGYEEDWSYTAASAGRAGTGYVNNYTGNLVWMHSDIGFGGNRAPVSISHVYNTNDIGNAERYYTGIGWKTSMNQRVYPCADDDDYYIWEDGDGTAHYMKKEWTGYYDVNNRNIKFTVQNDSSTKYFRIEVGNKTRYHFDNMRRLTYIEDFQRSSNYITITYTAYNTYKIATVTDGVGRVYKYNYNSAGLLESIVCTGTGGNELARVSFGYEGGNLTTITDIDGQRVSFGYDASNRLTTANDLIEGAAPEQDTVGQQLEYTYTGNRVTEIKSSDLNPDEAAADDRVDGGHMTIEYGRNRAVLTDEVNHITQITHFNDLGNLTSVQDELGRARHVNYTKMSKDDTAIGNELTLSSKLQNTVKNLFNDHSFEGGTAWTGGTVTDTQHYLGGKSLSVTGTATQTPVSVAKDESYSFSAWVKTGDKPAYLTLGTAQSQVLKANSDWTRLEVTYTANAAGSITPALVTEGTAYMDCVQLEKMAAASRYNLLEYGDFTSGVTGWTGEGFVAATADSAAPQLDSAVLSVTGNPEGQKRISQTLSISGSKDDTFVLSGWAKGNSAPISKENPENRTFGIEVTFNYTNEVEEPVDKKISFNPDTDGSVYWQYAAAPIVAEEAYDSVTVTITYDYNVNTAYFDGIQLFKETFGTSYTYFDTDDDGVYETISVVDLQNQVTEYDYNGYKNLVKVTLPNGGEITYDYDSYHNLTKTISAEGLTYKYEYDNYGNTTKVSITSGSQTISTSSTYTSDYNYLASATDALGKTTTYGYNTDTGILEWVQAPNDTADTRTEYTYDLATFLLETVSATTDTGLAMSVDYTYDNNLLKSIETPSTTYGFNYGVFGLRESVKLGTGENDPILASYSYYDNNYWLEALDYGNGDKVKYTYDSYGRLTKQTYLDHGADENVVPDTVTYLYDNDGVLAAVIDSASGITTRQYYDLSGRSTGYSETGTDFSHSVGYAYDESNNLSQLVEEINGTERTTSYTYDKDNRTTSVTTDGTTVDYTYDDYGRVTQQVTKVPLPMEEGQEEQQFRTVLTEDFTFVSNGNALSSQVDSYRTRSYDEDGTVIVDITYAYSYDNNGNIVEIKEKDNKTNIELITQYAYDSANQLIREDNPHKNKSYTWTYDNAGNILSHQSYAYSTEGLGTPDPNPATYTYGNSVWKDLLTAWNGKTITYQQEVAEVITDENGNPRTINNIGNPEQIGDRQFEWEHGRQLKKLTDSTVSWNYTYNNAGLRTARTNGTTTYKYIYDGSALVQMTVGNQTVSFTYDSGTPLTMKVYTTTEENGNTVTTCDTYYYVTNIQGDVMALVDDDGNTVISYSYTAYGEVTITDHAENDNADINPLTYKGYVYDVETGLFYLQSRYYDPEIGRFINADGLVATGQGILGNNMFAYCQNTPIMFADPSGYKLAPNPRTDEEEDQYNKAIEYLMQSETGRKLIEKLENSEIEFKIEFTDDGIAGYDYDAYTIYIDIDSGIVLGNLEEVLSPALSLAHEMGHAALHLDNKVYSSHLSDDLDELINETLNLWYYENRISMELGEPLRKFYYHGKFKTPVKESTYHSKPKPYPSWFKFIYYIP